MAPISDRKETMDELPRPIPDSYWVRPGRLLAGEYPGSKSDREARQKLAQLLDAGVTLFLDLTESDEYNLRPYAQFLAEPSLRRNGGVTHRRMAIRDQGAPTTDQMCSILDTIDAALEEGHTVYVHCWGGIGRTGTVIGCYLVRHGMDARAALDEIACLRAGTPDGWKDSPENRAQKQMVLDWADRDCASGSGAKEGTSRT
jgi:predicted protein tyrosine phosphatase